MQYFKFGGFILRVWRLFFSFSACTLQQYTQLEHWPLRSSQLSKIRLRMMKALFLKSNFLTFWKLKSFWFFAEPQFKWKTFLKNFIHWYAFWSKYSVYSDFSKKNQFFVKKIQLLRYLANPSISVALYDSFAVNWKKNCRGPNSRNLSFGKSNQKKFRVDYTIFHPYCNFRWKKSLSFFCS